MGNQPDHVSARRIDIDLLRAVAVLAVIFFHFEIPGFDGGFLGVDIFFVISGYLITLHIQQQLSESKFNFLYFYLRRIRRLFPALVAMLLICSIAALIILPKSLLENFSNSQIASSIYISNIYFWSVADYFDTESILKPLLHTWTLSVEEQFYIVWPLFVLIAFSWRPKIAISIAAVSSLIAAEVIYDISPSTTFYLFPFRIFEFAIGALVCDLSLDARSNTVKNIFLLVSGLGVALTLLLATEETRNPGVLTLPICIGTAIIIVLNHHWMNKRNVVTVILLRIGLVSYSAYLVHWPLVVFYKIDNPGPLSLKVSLSLVIATYVLAEIFYNFIERPTSRINIQNNNALLLFSLPLIICSAFVFNAIQPTIYRHLNPQEHTVQYVLDSIVDRRLILERIKNKILEEESRSALPKTRKIVVIGDSHAVDVSLSLQLLLARTDIEVVLFHSICDPLTISSITIAIDKLYENHPQKKPKNSEYCTPYHSSFLENISNLSPDLIVFSEAWRPEAFPFLPKTIEDIKEALKAEVLVLGKNTSFIPHPNIVFKSLENIEDINSVAWERRYRAFDAYDRQLLKVATDTGSYFISKNDLVCPDEKCHVLIGLDMGYADGSHWSYVGLEYYGRRLISHSAFEAATNW